MEVLRALYVCASGMRFSGRSRQEQLPKAISRVIKSHGATARALRHHDLRRGFAETRTNSHGATARARRHAQSPGFRATQKRQKKTLTFCTSTTPIPAEGRAGTARITKKPRVFAPRDRERARADRNRKKTSSFCASTTQRVHPRAAKTQKTSNYAPRPRRSRQRVARADQKSQKTWSFCASTTPIPAEGRKPDRRSKSCPGALES